MVQPSPVPRTAPTTPQQHRNGFGVTALVLGIVGVGLGLVPLLGLAAIILGVLALVFGLIGFSRTRRRLASNPTMTLIGAFLGAGSLALGIWGMVVLGRAVEDLDQAIGDLNRDLSSAVAPPPNVPPAPATAAPVVPPGATLPADMPALDCADFEPPPVVKPADKFTGRQCTAADGTTKWINGFFQCTDGKIWPILGSTQARPEEPASAEFDKCVGRR